MSPPLFPRAPHGVRCAVVGIGLCGAFAVLLLAAAPHLQAQEPGINDNLPAPRVLIPRTNLVPSDADYNAVTPRMMKPSVPLRNDPSVPASTSADAPRKAPKRGDSMASAYDAAPAPASTSASSAAGSASSATASSSAASGGKATAGTAKKDSAVVAQQPSARPPSSTPSGPSPADRMLPGGASDLDLMNSMDTDLRLEGKGPLVITDTASPSSVPGKAASSSASTAADASEMRAALPQVAAAQPNFRSTLPPLRAPRPPDQEYYNVKAGPALVRLSAELRTEFNDNINLSRDNKLSDFGVTPASYLSLKVPVTVVNGQTTNAINLDLGVGYTYWIQHGGAFSPLSTLNTTPSSSVSFNMMLGDSVVLTVFDNFGFQSNPIDVIDVQGVNAFQVFNNAMGVNAAWAVAQAVTINAGYGYGLDLHPQNSFDYLDDQTHNFSLAGTFALTEATSVGLQGTLSRTEYLNHKPDPLGNYRDDFWGASFGPYVSHRISDFMSVDASIGFSQYMFDTEKNPGTGIYYAGSFRHRLNDVFSYTIQGNRTTSTGASSDLLDTTTIAVRPNYQFLPDWTVGTDFFYQNSHAVGVNGGEKMDRYGIGIGVSHDFGQHLSGSASYRYSWKDSSIQANEYQQNQLLFSIDYAF